MIARLKSIVRVLAGRLGLPLVILGFSSVMAFYLFIPSQGFEAPREGRSVTRVEVVNITPSSETVIVSGFGTIEPSKTLDVRPEANGHVIAMHPDFIEGGRIPEGEVLLEIDPRDKKIELETSRANVIRAEFELKLEQGSSAVAEAEWKLLNKHSKNLPLDSELARRIPHLKEKEAQYANAKSYLERAELALERTKVRPPFFALVLEKHAEIGGYVDPGGVVARLASLDKFHVKVRVPDDSLQWLDFNDETGMFSSLNTVKVAQQMDGSNEIVREGKLERVLGIVEASGRMAQLLVSINDPLSTPKGGVPLLLGAYVRVDISGKKIDNVLAIPRSLLHEGDTVLVSDKNKRLRIRHAQGIFPKQGEVIIANNFNDGDQIIASEVPIPLEGMRLEIEPSTPQ